MPVPDSKDQLALWRRATVLKEGESGTSTLPVAMSAASLLDTPVISVAARKKLEPRGVTVQLLVKVSCRAASESPKLPPSERVRVLLAVCTCVRTQSGISPYLARSPIDGRGIYTVMEKPLVAKKLGPGRCHVGGSRLDHLVGESTTHMLLVTMLQPHVDPIIWSIQIGDELGARKRVLNIPVPVAPLSFWTPWRLSQVQCQVGSTPS